MQIFELFLDEEKAHEDVSKEVKKDDWTAARLAEVIDQTMALAAKRMAIPFAEYLDALRTIRDYIDECDYEIALQLLIQLAEQLDTNSHKILESLVFGGKVDMTAYLRYLSEYIIDWYEIERIFMLHENRDEWPEGCMAVYENEVYMGYLKEKHALMEEEKDECKSDGDM